MDNTVLENAKKQLQSIGIVTTIENESLYVLFDDVQLELSDFEIRFRCNLYIEEVHQNG